MIDAQVKFERQERKLLEAVDRAKAGSLSSTAFVVRETAIRSIKQSKAIRGYFRKKNRRGKVVLATYYEPAPAGQPPLAHRRGLGFFRAGVKYAVDQRKDDAVVGWAHSKVKGMFRTHEHGGTFRGAQYDKRPTMAPALQASIDKFHRDWQSSVG